MMVPTDRRLLLCHLLRCCLSDYLRIADPDMVVHLLPEKSTFPDLPEWADDQLGVVALVPTVEGQEITLLLQPEESWPADRERLGRYFLRLEAQYLQPVLLNVVYLTGGQPGPNLQSTLLQQVNGLELTRMFYTAFGLELANARRYLDRPEPLAWALASAMRSGLAPDELRTACLARIRDTPRSVRVKDAKATAPLPEEVRALLAQFVESSLPLP